ncbi:DUF397 domain-containing protein [Streptomyces aidingensis]|uniref:DUF397 domain-containing protein n=1 Tax=Streptomyces aidingensis TaxID=910347 RepID=A0A1I1MAT1_9ACTN|nr:DUF397 domain-containing protein [Streptomyces aidingensis]SFC82557.1 protein of unknown function [Streptomyces aidingensis]
MSTGELVWFKSSYSGPEGDSCVEVATSRPGVVHVRDSKDEHSPHLTLSPAAWQTFLTCTVR